jgi:hypothetical protein
MRISTPNVFDFENVYVEGMTHHAQLDRTNQGVIEFWAPVAASATGYMTLTAFTAGQEREVDIDVDGPFGRRIQVGSSGSGTVTVTGMDYLNQKMTQELDVSNNNVTSTKAFKKITRIKSSAAISVRCGPGAGFGMPFTVRDVLSEYEGATSKTVGDVVAPDATDPATSETGDPRGIYTPATTQNGSNNFVITALFDPNAHKGLYGVRQV